MPRDRKGQPPRAANDQAYGMRNELMEAQKQIPLPNRAGTPMPQEAPPAPPPEEVSGDAAFQDMLAKVQQMQRLPAGQSLRAPTQYPNEPLTAGIPSGPGPGPVRPPAGPRQQAADFLMRLASRTGDPKYAQLAQRAARR